MSHENVEIVRQVFEAAARRDQGAALSLYAGEIEWDTSRRGTPGDMAGSGIYRGHDGLRAWFRSWHEAWEDLVDHLDEVVDAGDRILSVVTMRARGRASGAEVTSRRYFGVWTIRDGKVTRVVWFSTRAEALEAAGLSE